MVPSAASQLAKIAAAGCLFAAISLQHCQLITASLLRKYASASQGNSVTNRLPVYVEDAAAVKLAEQRRSDRNEKLGLLCIHQVGCVRINLAHNNSI